MRVRLPRPMCREQPARRAGFSPVWIVAGVAMATSLVFWAKGSVADGGFDPYYFGEMGRSIADGHGFEGFGNL